jgi:hypothetical protein
MIKTTEGFFLYFGSSGVAVRLVHQEEHTVWDFTNEELSDDADWADTLKTVETKQTAVNGYYVELPSNLPVGTYDVLAYDGTSPVAGDSVDYFDTLEVSK